MALQGLSFGTVSLSYHCGAYSSLTGPLLAADSPASARISLQVFWVVGVHHHLEFLPGFQGLDPRWAQIVLFNLWASPWPWILIFFKHGFIFTLCRIIYFLPVWWYSFQCGDDFRKSALIVPVHQLTWVSSWVPSSWAPARWHVCHTDSTSSSPRL